ncbi:beta-propeller fold lactonase family protein [Nocardioides sp. zg-579]|uniref:Beta-propeller fold lactonase family protein n=1 Tax=Nocardioides marmotae TaxID=2663857 RepID=A0A6I3JEL0_9ACTN|nr:beta-propeller fold lactonase family protein [Nocardioides marmotae]MCR6032897.1 beta-propeller fold lactonase family protein [Gordonia jinghuaiqii]MTB96547.1 beta-propeller fold lactonase family protein [Nocardioides marmotae]QKE01933.1 beta-propeller fold lactonase family protein [Nocardioides marmotae]
MALVHAVLRTLLPVGAALGVVLAGTLVAPTSAQQTPEIREVGSVVLPETDRGVLDLAVSTNGKRAVAVSGDWLQVVALTEGDPQLLGSTRTVFGEQVELSRDGRTAYVLSQNDTLYVVDVSGTKAPRMVRKIQHKKLAPSHVFGMVASRDGRFLYLKHGFEYGDHGTGKGIQVLSLAKPRKPRQTGRVKTPEWDGDIAISADGKHLVTSNHTTDDYLLQYKVDKRTGKPTKVKRLRLSFRGDAVAIDDQNRAAYVLSGGSTTSELHVARLNLKKKRVAKAARIPAQEDGLGLAVSPDGRYLYATTWRASPAEQQSFLALDARSLAPLHGARGEELYAPQTVQVSRRGPTKGNIYVPTYTGVRSGSPLLLALTYR